eukprot:6133004-Prorocentrum_lima.AAC.1
MYVFFGYKECQSASAGHHKHAPVHVQRWRNTPPKRAYWELLLEKTITSAAKCRPRDYATTPPGSARL